MNLKNKMIMEEYRESRNDFLQLGDEALRLLRNICKEQGVQVMTIEHRVKAEDSLAGKLELKGDKYASLADITDILGARIICYFSDDVDRVAKGIQNYFDIDWENSVDKRAVLNTDSFGYLSLHYIVKLPNNGKYPKNIVGKKFEIQIRSILQHTWAAINHDLGYKSEFGVPKSVTREFSRIAGILEVADELFVSLRDRIAAYGDEIRSKIASDEAGDVNIDLVSLTEYIRLNSKMKEFLKKTADFCGAEINEISPESYIEQLRFLGKRDLSDLHDMLENDEELALKLAEKSLSGTDLDILSSNVGLRFLCRAELLNKQYSEEDIVKFMKFSVNDDARAKRQANYLISTYKKINGDNDE